MDTIFENLMDAVRNSYKEHGTLTNDILSVLHSVIPGPLLAALDLIDRQAVTILESPSGRRVYQVIGSSGTPYICLLSTDYCSCPAYKYAVLTRGDTKYCKHLLSIRLSVAMETCKQQEISNSELTSALHTI